MQRYWSVDSRRQDNIPKYPGRNPPKAVTLIRPLVVVKVPVTSEVGDDYSSMVVELGMRVGGGRSDGSGL